MRYHEWRNKQLTEQEWNEIMEGHSSGYLQYYSSEMRRIVELEEEEQNRQMKQLIKVMDQMQILEELEIQRNKKHVIEDLKNKGVCFLKSQKTAEELRRKWKEHFLEPFVNLQEMKAIHADEYLWHGFTYGKIPKYKEGQAAIEAFREKEKQKVYVFYQLEDEVLYLDTKNQLDVLHLRFETTGKDMYLTDEEFTWTYVYKHCDTIPIWCDLEKYE